MNSVTGFILNSQTSRPRCGQCGWIQLSAWEALDLGLGYDEWVTQIPEQMMMAPATLRIQFRKAEKDRNACLVDDGHPEQQTLYGKITA